MRFLPPPPQENTAAASVKSLLKRHYYICYTICFLVISLVAFSWYFFSRKTLIWNADGWTQHYRALVYYGRYLRSIIQNIFIYHNFTIPAWDFSIGEGSDILITLHYYVIGDPLNLTAALVPTRYMWILYEFLILFRLYLAGLSFSLLCRQTGIQNRYGILAGSMTYTFCSWVLTTCVQHPFFLNPMIFLPLLVLGVENVIARKHSLLLTVTVFSLLSAISIFSICWSYQLSFMLSYVLSFCIGQTSVKYFSPC